MRRQLGGGLALGLALGLAGCSAPPSPTSAPVVTSTIASSEPIATVSSTEPRHVFPVSPQDDASYGREHHDYPATDIFAACGSDVVAVTAGVVEEASLVDTWDRTTDDPADRGGLSVSLVGDDGVRYYMSHLADVAGTVRQGARVEAGAVLGHVGDTGNAVGLGCHVHFGISPDCGPGDWEVRRGVVSPWPYLDIWRTGGQATAADEVAQWLAAHPDGQGLGKVDLVVV